SCPSRWCIPAVRCRSATACVRPGRTPLRGRWLCGICAHPDPSTARPTCAGLACLAIQRGRSSCSQSCRLSVFFGPGVLYVFGELPLNHTGDRFVVGFGEGFGFVPDGADSHRADGGLPGGGAAPASGVVGHRPPASINHSCPLWATMLLRRSTSWLWRPPSVEGFPIRHR